MELVHGGLGGQLVQPLLRGTGGLDRERRRKMKEKNIEETRKGRELEGTEGNMAD